MGVSVVSFSTVTPPASSTTCASGMSFDAAISSEPSPLTTSATLPVCSPISEVCGILMPGSTPTSSPRTPSIDAPSVSNSSFSEGFSSMSSVSTIWVSAVSDNSSPVSSTSPGTSASTIISGDVSPASSVASATAVPPILTSRHANAHEQKRTAIRGDIPGTNRTMAGSPAYYRRLNSYIQFAIIDPPPLFPQE